MSRRPDPPPLRSDDARTILVGVVLWGVALVLAVLFRARLRDGGHLWWIATCAFGFGLGLVGLRYTRRHSRRTGAPSGNVGRRERRSGG